MRLLVALAFSICSTLTQAQSLEALCYRTDQGNLYLTPILHDYYQRYEGFIITPPPVKEVIYFTWSYTSTQPTRIAIVNPDGKTLTYPIEAFEACHLNP